MADRAGLSVGVIIPAFNAAEWIGQCLASVVAQTHREWTLVVVDDGSTDGTACLVPSDARISVVTQANAGVSAARNRGRASLPPVDAILFLDADDWLAPDALSRLVEALARNPAASAAIGPWAVASAAGGLVRSARRPALDWSDPLYTLVRRNPFANGGHVLIRASALAGAGEFRADLRFGEDWEFWVRLVPHGGFVPTRDNHAVLFVREVPSGAYRRLIQVPAFVEACLDAIFTSAIVGDRAGANGRSLRRRAETEMDWVLGRELFRSGQDAEARRLLRRCMRRAPSLKRLIVTALAHAPQVWPDRLRGPFSAYRRDPGRSRSIHS